MAASIWLIAKEAMEAICRENPERILSVRSLTW